MSLQPSVSSPRRDRCTRADGLTKRCFPSKKAAKRHMRRGGGGRKDTTFRLGDVHAYRCDCGWFHIGHRQNRKTRRNP